MEHHVSIMRDIDLNHSTPAPCIVLVSVPAKSVVLSKFMLYICLLVNICGFLYLLYTVYNICLVEFENCNKQKITLSIKLSSAEGKNKNVP